MTISRLWLFFLLFYAALVADSTAAQERLPTSAVSADVVVIHDHEASEAFRPKPDVIRQMVERGVTKLTAKKDIAEAWRSLVNTQDVVGIKVFSAPGPNSGTRPAVVAALISGLIAAGVPAKSIIVWDKSATDLRLAGFFELGERYGVRVAGSSATGYDEDTFYDTALIGTLLWGDYEFGKKGPGVGRKSFVSRLVSKEITKIISVVPLLNHNHAGVSGHLYSLASGSVDNFARFEGDANRLANSVPEIYALPCLSDRVVLNIVDALLCQYEGSERGLLHYTTVLNELRFSRDPVALDVLSIQELERQRQMADAPRSGKSNSELYANAALLELGVNDLKKIRLRRMEDGTPAGAEAR